jgi:hypothetical protein
MVKGRKLMSKAVFVKRDFAKFLQYNIDKRFAVSEPANKNPIVYYLKNRYTSPPYTVYAFSNGYQVIKYGTSSGIREYPKWMHLFVEQLFNHKNYTITGYECLRIICPVNSKREKYIKRIMSNA